MGGFRTCVTDARIKVCSFKDNAKALGRWVGRAFDGG